MYTDYATEMMGIFGSYTQGISDFAYKKMGAHATIQYFFGVLIVNHEYPVTASRRSTTR